MTSTAKRKTVANQVVETLREIGVRHIFGVPSGGWVDYMEAIRELDDLEFVLVGHEGSAGVMADVCGRITGSPGACFGTFGPGATNLSTGVGGALLDRSPLIALTDEMPDHMLKRTAQMNIDHQALFRPITKRTTRLHADHVRATIYKAAQVATTERPGPVHIGLPVGMGARRAPDEDVTPLFPVCPSPPDTVLLSEMEKLFEQSRKPILALGLGAVRAGVRSLVLKIAGKHQVPVVITPMAKGIVPEDYPCYVGVLFHALSDHVALTHQQADLVIAIGYDPVEFNYEDWLPDAPLITIDTMPADLDRGQCTLACEIVGDLRPALERLANVEQDRKAWDMGALSERRRKMFERLRPVSENFGPCAALTILREMLPENGVMTCDVGAHTHLIGQQWRTPAPGLQIMTNGWSSMGFGIPAAIAAKLCLPDTPVCSVVGDGGFLMTVGELATAVRLNLHIVVVLLTDNDLALIRIKQQRKGNPSYGTRVRYGESIATKNIFGVPVLEVGDETGYGAALEKAFSMDGPVLVEATVDSSEYDGLILRKHR